MNRWVDLKEDRTVAPMEGLKVGRWVDLKEDRMVAPMEGQKVDRWVDLKEDRTVAPMEDLKEQFRRVHHQMVMQRVNPL